MRIFNALFSVVYRLVQSALLLIIWLPYFLWDTDDLKDHNEELYRAVLAVTLVSMAIALATVIILPLKHPIMTFVCAYLMMGLVAEMIFRVKRCSMFPPLFAA